MNKIYNNMNKNYLKNIKQKIKDYLNSKDDLMMIHGIFLMHVLNMVILWVKND